MGAAQLKGKPPHRRGEVKLRATILALTVAAGLATTAGTALSGVAPVDPGQQARCERAQARLDFLLGQRAEIEVRAAEVQARIDSGELTPRQLARAGAQLARLNDRLARMDERIAAVEGRIAERCVGTDPGDGGGGGGTIE
jgi:hypothetical protein